MSVNKQAASRDAGLILQTGYSARALLGLLGSDDFSLKVSPDGSAFATALTASAAKGGIDFASTETVLASAATTDLGSSGTRRVLVTGTARITRFGTGADRERLLRFAGAATLVHDAEQLALPTRADIVTAADDTCLATSDGAGRWRVRHYQRADGTPLALGTQVLAPAGYARLANGLILHWGLATSTDADVSVSFAPAFPSACLGVWTQPVARDAGTLYASQVSDVTARRLHPPQPPHDRRHGDRCRKCSNVLAGIGILRGADARLALSRPITAAPATSALPACRTAGSPVYRTGLRSPLPCGRGTG